MPPTQRFDKTQEGTSPPSDHNEEPSDPLCVHCAYNLRGLASDGRCPECGTSIARSIRGDLLWQADLAWLTRVSGGFTLTKDCFVTWLAGLAAGLTERLVLGSSEVSNFLEPVWATTIATLLLVGIFRVMTPDPRLSLREQPIALRRIVRLAAIAALLLGVSMFIPFSKSTGAASILSDTFAVVMVFTFVAATYCLVHLAERIPDAELAKRTKTSTRRFAVCFAVGMVFTRIDIGFHSVTILSCCTLILVLIAAIGNLVYGVGLIRLWFVYRKAIKHCLAKAIESEC